MTKLSVCRPTVNEDVCDAMRVIVGQRTQRISLPFEFDMPNQQSSLIYGVLY